MESKKSFPYEIIEEIGKGKFGKVFVVENNVTNKARAMKQIDKVDADAYNIPELFAKLKNLDHPNIMKYYEFFEDQENYYIIMDFAEKGDLMHLIEEKKAKKTQFSEQEIRKYLKQIVDGLKYLHSKGIMHRDLKPENILLDAEGNVKITDFGLCRMFTEQSLLKMSQSQMSDLSNVGTDLYIPPELYGENEKLHYDFRVDVWCLGEILYELITLEHPFLEENMITESFADAVQNKGYKKIKRKISQDLKDLLDKMLMKDYKKRITVDGIWLEIVLHNIPSDARITSVDRRIERIPIGL